MENKLGKSVFVAVFAGCSQLCLSFEPFSNANNELFTYDVYHLTHLIDGHEQISMVADFFHSGIGFKSIHGSGHFVAEYWANNLDANTIIPTLHNGRLQFNNHVTAAFKPASDFNEWQKMQKVGTISYDVLIQYSNWIDSWMSKCGGYQLWSVANSMEMVSSTDVYIQECDCHRFAEDSLAQLYYLGAHFTTQEPFCRNYFPLPSKGPLASVSESSTQLRSFYQSFRKIFLDADAKSAFNKLLSWAEEQYEPYFYVPQTVLNSGNRYRFYHVPLTSPAFVRMPSYSSQRMILPWQDNSEPCYCRFGATTCATLATNAHSKNGTLFV